MDLYPESKKRFSEDLFKEPTSVYRGAPFWAWNHHLEEETIRKQVGIFREMGMGGYHAHVRTGLDTPYLGEEFMHMMQAALDEAKSKGLLHWLYDEDRWPSGAAGGLVTEDPDLAQKKLMFTAFPEKGAVPFQKDTHFSYGKYYELGRYQVELKNGFLSSYKRVSGQEEADWYAYLYLTPCSPWYNNKSYVDTLKKSAIEKFLRITHDTYAQWFQDDFGTSIPAIFTDEPQFARKETLKDPSREQSVNIPFTDDLEETYTEAYGQSLLDHLPELFWEWEDGHISVTRYHYHDHVCERFASGFADTIGAWCREHGLMLTGHMMEEPTLESQTGMLGEAMRSYRGFGLPGIDMLCDRREYTTAKQAQSATHQLGCPGVLSELYGVTNWDFDFRGHKLQGDWQAALGVTTRVHHLTWMSMEGEAKRDYPACIGFQSPWYKEYKKVEDHFARVNTAMTRGTAKVRIGVIHPIESYWLYFGSNEKTGMIREEMDEQFQALNRMLLLDTLDFDYISESLLTSLPAQKEEALFTAGAMRYEVIVVPPLKTIRSATLERLEAFVQAGGKVIFLQEAPKLVDAVPSERAVLLQKQCLTVPFIKTRILEALEPWRDVEILSLSRSVHTDHFLYQMREDGRDRWLFVARGTKMEDPDQPKEEAIEIRIKGTWRPVFYDTIRGTRQQIPYAAENDFTIVRFSVYEHDSLLIRLEPGTERQADPAITALHPEVLRKQSVTIEDIVPARLEEPNVLLLDMARYRLDQGAWMPKEEILRIDNAVRDILGYPHRKKEVAQPWTMEEEPEYKHRLELSYTVELDTDLEGLSLALENRKNSSVQVDGEPVSMDQTGWYVDPAIETIGLPPMKKGQHKILISYPYGPKTNPENAFLLGDFSVQVQGQHCVLGQAVRELAFSDLCHQGLPFYGGNVVYDIPVELEQDGQLSIEATQFRAPLWAAALDDGEYQDQPFAPYQVVLPAEKGGHTLHLKVYGSRINTFGQVHNCDETMDWFGPDSWRTEGTAWSYEYHLHRTGFLKSPTIYIE